MEEAGNQMSPLPGDRANTPPRVRWPLPGRLQILRSGVDTTWPRRRQAACSRDKRRAPRGRRPGNACAITAYPPSPPLDFHPVAAGMLRATIKLLDVHFDVDKLNILYMIGRPDQPRRRQPAALVSGRTNPGEAR